MQDAVGLKKSAKALEESFFAAENERLLAKLRERGRQEQQRNALREALGTDDEQLLDRLVELELSPETVVAVNLVPLVEVAWADGEIQDRERDAILRGAAEHGVAPGSTSYQLLENWLNRKPGDELLEAWKHYVSVLVSSLGPAAAALLEKRSLGGARVVAEAAGGFLGLGSVSASEKAVLEDLARAFG